MIGGDATELYRRGPRDLRAVAALAIVAVALAACSSSPSSTPTTTTPSTSTSTTTATDAEDVAVLAAYRAAWAAYEQATKTANPLDPALSATMVDPLLEQVKKNLVSYEVGGIIGKGSLTLHPHVASLSATSSQVRDCMFSDAFLVYKKTGKQVPPVTKPEHDGVRATLVLDGSTWKMSKQTVMEGTCPAGY